MPTNSEDVMEYVYQFTDIELVNVIITKTYTGSRTLRGVTQWWNMSVYESYTMAKHCEEAYI